MGILHDHVKTPHSTTVTRSTPAFNIPRCLCVPYHCHELPEQYQPVFITQTHCVLCEVETYILYLHFRLQPAVPWLTSPMGVTCGGRERGKYPSNIFCYLRIVLLANEFFFFIQLRTAALRLIVRSWLDVPTFATRRLHACHHASAPSVGKWNCGREMSGSFS
jgi:hypothetical protein